MKPKVGETYVYNSASNMAFDVWRRPVRIPAGRHIFVKQKDTIIDKLCGRSWYIVDGIMLIFVQFGGVVEERCLQKHSDERKEE